MADEYRVTLPKTAPGGFAESPQQDVGNAGSPGFLNSMLTTKNAITGAVGYSYGKQVIQTGFGAVIDQIGSSGVEEVINGVSKGLGYVALGIATGGLLVPVIAGVAEGISLGITTAVDNHAINLENANKRVTRGTLNNLSGSDYFG